LERILESKSNSNACIEWAIIISILRILAEFFPPDGFGFLPWEFWVSSKKISSKKNPLERMNLRSLSIAPIALAIYSKAVILIYHAPPLSFPRTLWISERLLPRVSLQAWTNYISQQRSSSSFANLKLCTFTALDSSLS